MGRFNHEALAIDPQTHIVYLTEDRHDGLFYRFIPHQKGNLAAGGKLQALAFVWKKSLDTRNWEDIKLYPSLPYSVRWITLHQVDSTQDDLRLRGYQLGAARFARGEGIWFGQGELFFACTNGGKTKTGQIFRYIPSKYEGTSREKEKAYQPKIELYAEPNNTKLLKYCDNLTIAPWGDLVFAEDHAEARIIGITPKGKYYLIAQNIGPASEIAGLCFSPSGKTLFANLQDTGKTVAITGFKT
jgi:secreted PhoX family phosphatase